MPHLPLKAFYFIRHGETDWNRRNIIMGQTDIPLNNWGIKQAEEARKSFKNIVINNIYTSPLKRAAETAEILNQDFNHVIIINEGLKERSWGEREGKPHSISLTSMKDSEIPKGAEQWREFELRVLSAVNEILESSSIIPPLIVAHGGVFVVLTKYFDMQASMRANNCSSFLFTPPSKEIDKWAINNLRNEDETFEL